MTVNLKQKLVSGVIWSLGDRLISQLGFLIVTLYLARVIGPTAYGLVGMLTIFMLLAESVVNNGFSQALVQRSNALTTEDTSTIFYVNLVWGISMYFILYFCAPLIADFYNEPELVDISRLLFLIIIINSLSVVVRAKLLINVDFKSQAISALIATIISSTIAIYLAMHGFNYWAFVWLLLLKALCLNILLWFFANWRPRLIFSWASFRSLFGFGSNLMAAGLVATTVNNLYIAMIGRYFNASNVGYFTQASTLTDFLSQFISSTLQGVTYPILASIKEERERLIGLYQKLIAITMLVSLPLLVGFAAVADTFVLLFLGEVWLPAVPIIQILCFARAITPISSINMNILNAIGRSDLFLRVDIIKLPITLITLFISITFGIEAVAWALFINVMLSFFINAYYPGKMFGFGAWAQLKVAQNYVLSAVIMYILVTTLVSFQTLWLDLIFSLFLGVTTYFILLFVLKDTLLMVLIAEVTAKIKKDKKYK